MTDPLPSPHMCFKKDRILARVSYWLLLVTMHPFLHANGMFSYTSQHCTKRSKNMICHEVIKKYWNIVEGM